MAGEYRKRSTSTPVPSMLFRRPRPTPFADGPAPSSATTTAQLPNACRPSRWTRFRNGAAPAECGGELGLIRTISGIPRSLCDQRHSFPSPLRSELTLEASWKRTASSRAERVTTGGGFSRSGQLRRSHIFRNLCDLGAPISVPVRTRGEEFD
jgi:hypothetical protein